MTQDITQHTRISHTSPPFAQPTPYPPISLSAPPATSLSSPTPSSASSPPSSPPTSSLSTTSTATTSFSSSILSNSAPSPPPASSLPTSSKPSFAAPIILDLAIARNPTIYAVSTRTSSSSYSSSNASFLAIIKYIPYTVTIITIDSVLIPTDIGIFDPLNQTGGGDMLYLTITDTLIQAHDFNVAVSMLNASGLVSMVLRSPSSSPLTPTTPPSPNPHPSRISRLNNDDFIFCCE